jgi:two-component system LytT family response regulator
MRALLVDDELHNLKTLSFLLENDCENITMAGMVQSTAQAKEWLGQHTADVIFLDINMPVESGFELLKHIDMQQTRVVFVTAYSEYAIRALKAGAVDYLLKPVQAEELQATVNKLALSFNNSSLASQNQQLLQQFLTHFPQKGLPLKIAIPQLGGINFVNVEDIISLQADSNYTILHLGNMQKIVVSKTLKDFEEILDGRHFVRIHKSYIVHLKYIREYSTTDGGTVKMTDGNLWSISRRQLDIFLEKMRSASLGFGKQ